MKCIILAGGSGDRLWPLSRKNFPKQFLNLDGGNSLFQETVTRNIPYCDKFYIMTNCVYQDIVESQMKQFQGISYQIVFEQNANGTAPALDMVSKIIEDDEELLVTPADLYIHGDGYSEAIYKAKEFSRSNKFVLFGIRAEEPSTIYGYIRYKGNDVMRFIEKPSQTLAEKIFSDDDIFWNSGMIMCFNSHLRKELDKHKTLLYNSKERLHIEKVLLEQTKHLSVVPLRCVWSDISNFDTYQNLAQERQDRNSISSSCENTTIVNTSDRQLVVANRLKDVYIINTNDAIYITDKENEQDIKSIILHSTERYGEYFDTPPIVYRPWGTREVISHEKGYRVRRLTIYAGKSISKHSHIKRNENYSIVEGVLSVELENEVYQIASGESINILPNQKHRLFNDTDKDVIAIEVDTGDEINEQDMIHFEECVKDDLPNLYRLKPAYKDYLWGGKRLVELFHKDTPFDITAESWELSAHPDGQSRIYGNGFFGMPFGDFIREHGSKVCGWKSTTYEHFPILIKFIDATNSLSVQVHPYDDYAFVNEFEFGKNEMWYVMDAKPDSYLYCGFSREVSKEEIKQRILENNITDILNKVQVSTGDVIFIPAGTIHAIGEGLLICEIQQNSNSTYRVYDYERCDVWGNKRPLHIDKALDVISTGIYEKNEYGFEKPVQEGNSTRQKLCLCKYFECTKYTVQEKVSIYLDDSSFASLVFLSGTASINCQNDYMEANAGDSFFVSAGRKVVHVEGQCEFILTNI